MSSLGFIFPLILIWTAAAQALVTETGTLRGFLLGDCPGCAYDNWTSHVVEGLANPGYNDYGPSWLDPQTNGFGHFTLIPSDSTGDPTISAWRAVFQAAVNEQWLTLDALVAAQPGWRYELVEFTDTELNRVFYVLRERLDYSYFDDNVDSVATDDVAGSFANGWGVFVFNPTAVMEKLLMECVHPQDDFLAVPVVIELFLRTEARVLMIAGAGREARWDTTGGGSYNNSRSLSDPSRNGRTPFHVCHQVFYDALNGGATSPCVTVQMHSYDTRTHGGLNDVHVSAFADDSRPNPPLRDRAEHLDLIHLMGLWPVAGIGSYPEVTRRIDQYVSLYCSPSYYYYFGGDSLPILSSTDLIGYGYNQQGQYSHQGHHVDLDPENFIHVEIDEYPDGLWLPERWRDWLPGSMPATYSTFALALEYYEAFIVGLDSALRASFLYPDLSPPETVELLQAIHVGGDSVLLRWEPPAADRFFDTYVIYYDTVPITPGSPQFTRTRAGYSSLMDFATRSVRFAGLTPPLARYNFAVGSRDIYGNAATLSNSLSITGGYVAFRYSDSYMGCGEACRGDTLLLTFNEPGYLAGQIFLVLPPELEAAWPAGNQAQNVLPATNRATNLLFAMARRVGSTTSDTIEVNVQWGPPYSDGNANRYLAALPIRNQLALATGAFTAVGLDSTQFYRSDGGLYNQFAVGPGTVYVDCSAPTSSISYGTPPTCAFGSSFALQGRMRISISRGTSPFNSQLRSAYVEVNGNASQRITLFNTLQGGSYSNNSFPSAAQASLLWGYLTEGCNTLTVRATDNECNESVSAALVVRKDVTAPALTVVNSQPAFCYNNVAGSQNYGGTLLDDHLDISAGLRSDTCAAATGTLSISYGANSFPAINLPPDLNGYPSSDSAASALWTWIIGQVPPNANGETFLFNVRAQDCAGNSAGAVFTLCIDLTPPPNTMVEFDARPSDLGVWLRWQWSYQSTAATVMEVWRSNFTGDYPRYSANRWSNLSDTAHYPTSYPPPGFARIVAQSGAVATTSRFYTGSNGQGRLIIGGPDSSYWLDEDGSWVDESEDRDIYRYITYLKDAGGNTSRVTSYSLNVNADRATNYWLGDYTRDVAIDPNGSSGIVNTADLSLLSAVYFTSVPPAAAFYDIGPENAENGMGKGIPTPDAFVDFFDLVPFSANFGTTGPNSFSLPPVHLIGSPEEAENPHVELGHSTSDLLCVGDEILFTVALAGNSNHTAKIVEARLEFDSNVMEVLELTPGSAVVENGLPFVSLRTLGAREGANDPAGASREIGIAFAAIGQSARLQGNLIMAQIRLGWKNKHAERTDVTLREIRLADVAGTIREQETKKITLEAAFAIPLEFALHVNYPNPFNSRTAIRFDLPVTSQVRIDVFNLTGQHVITLLDGVRPAGAHRINWEGTNDSGLPASSGMYLCVMRAAGFMATTKLVLIR